MKNVAKTKVGDNLKEAVLEVVNLLGGFGKFVETGDTVLLKPNFNTADPFPASTDPEFLKAVVELVYDYGAKLVMVGDSSTMTLNTRKVMERLGVFDLTRLEKPPRICVFEESEWIKKEIPDGKYLKSASVPAFLDKVDKLILLPCLKTHCYARFTGALKLAVGFMKPSERIRLHFRHLQEKIAELNKIINPSLVIMDGRKCFINKGPSEGELQEPGLILASEDRISIDVEGIKIIQSYKGNSLAGINPEKLRQIEFAKEIGL